MTMQSHRSDVPPARDAESLAIMPARRSTARDVIHHIFRDPVGLIGLVLVLGFLLSGALGPFIAPYDPNLQHLDARFERPSGTFLLGTDELGRDMLSRILHASRTGVIVAVSVTGIASLIGTVLGAFGGYLGGFVDLVIGRLIDLVQSFPYLLFVIFMNATLTPLVARLLTDSADGVPNATIQYTLVIGVLGFLLWGSTARLMRGQVMALREREFVLAARAEGAKTWTIVRRHLLPHAIGPVIVSASITFGGALLLEASLSFLGIGIQPPNASLGSMIEQNSSQWRHHPGVILIPAAVLAVVLVGTSFLGDSLNDALDPKRKRR